jgi:hypothetical protein
MRESHKDALRGVEAVATWLIVVVAVAAWVVVAVLWHLYS